MTSVGKRKSRGNTSIFGGGSADKYKAEEETLRTGMLTRHHSGQTAVS